jgi:beta-galactosidase
MALAILAAAAPLFAAEAIPAQPGPRVSFNFDAAWSFYKGDARAAAAPVEWRTVNLPHDWSIEGPYDQNAITLRGGGYLPAGIGTYSKEFTLPAEYRGKRLFIDFDGVMANSEVWINEEPLGRRPYGFSSFQYELTDKLAFDKPNRITVRAENTAQPASRFYVGAGIYRHVRLEVREPVHMDHWATFVSTPEVKGEQATVRVKTTLINQSDAARPVSLEVAIMDGKTLIQRAQIPAKEIAAGKSAEFSAELYVDRPEMWDIDNPHLYHAVVTATSNGSPIDRETVPFGIRLMEWKPATGFWLNGNNVKILGACMHSDGGAVGAAVPASIWERRLLALKSLGVNAIRTAHNPMAPEFFDICDRLGIMAMEESFDTWTAAKPNGQQGYNTLFNQWFQADTRDMVLRDRNHPSIIIWSAGNEIRDNVTAQAGIDRYLAMQNIYRDLDGTRPATFALFRPTPTGVYAPGAIADQMDVVGQNYAEASLIAAYEQNPSRKVLGTENTHELSAWRALRDNAFMAGQFLWVGFDYLGEADWPQISRYNGLFDRTLAPHTRAYQRQSWWSKKPMVAVARNNPSAPAAATAADGDALKFLADWTPVEGDAYKEAQLQVYTNCQEVELFLNSKSLGKKPRNADDSPVTFRTPFEPGTLRAVGRNDNQEAAGFEMKTAGKAVKLAAASDRAAITPGFDDVAIVEVLALDEGGVRNPLAANPITFKIDGPGQIIAVDNGDKLSHESYQDLQRQLYRGRAIAIIRATGNGKITVTASTDGRAAAAAVINATPPAR